MRPGFPYSLFLERVGPGREPYIGPGRRTSSTPTSTPFAESATAALVYPLAYIKNHGVAGAVWDAASTTAPTRPLGLQPMAPEMARPMVRQTHSNGRPEPRVFHWMEPLVSQEGSAGGAGP